MSRLGKIAKRKIVNEAVELYLYYKLIGCRTKFIERKDDFTWVFEDVNHQTCFVRDFEKSKISQNKARILKRRAETITFVNYGLDDLTKVLGDQQLQLNFSKHVFACTIIHDNEISLNLKIERISNTKQFNYLRSLTKNSFDLFFKNLEWLFDQTFFEAFVVTEEGNLSPLYMIGVYTFEHTVIVDTTFLNHVNKSNSCEYLMFIVEKITKGLVPFPLIILDHNLPESGGKLRHVSSINIYNTKVVEKNFRYPSASSPNGVLKTNHQWLNSVCELEELGLPLHNDLPKNWDSLLSLSTIVKNIHLQTGMRCQDAKVLDAGGEFYSVILQQLAAFGFKNLYSVNLSFSKSTKLGHIRYKHGDITKTKFKNSYFDAIACLSVIEHGVMLQDYFKEMSRILKPNGLLITSTDYWETKVDCGDKTSFNLPVKIFNKEEIYQIVKLASSYKLHLIGQMDFNCQDKVINHQGLEYTFIYFTFRKAS